MTPDPEEHDPEEPGEPGTEPEIPPTPGPRTLPHCRKCGAIAKFNPDGSIECDEHGIVTE